MVQKTDKTSPKKTTEKTEAAKKKKTVKAPKAEKPKAAKTEKPAKPEGTSVVKKAAVKATRTKKEPTAPREPKLRAKTTPAAREVVKPEVKTEHPHEVKPVIHPPVSVKAEEKPVTKVEQKPVHAPAPKVVHAPAKPAPVHPAPAPAPKVVSTTPHPAPAVAVHKAPVAQPSVPSPIKPSAPLKADVQPSAPVAPAPAAPVAVAAKPATVAPPKMKGVIKINELVTVRELAEKMNVRVGEVLKKLLTMGSMATINQRLDSDIAILLANEFEYDAKFTSLYSEEDVAETENPALLKPRWPVVTIMGHVDHGKTSLLDAIRKSRVAEGEAGGITQHIGAYKVKVKDGQIAFLDTPGHEAFTAMRSRGAQATDLVILVVSAADGVMPQTVEAIDHAKAANVPIIVAINKIDLPTAQPAQIKQELSKYGLVAEDWGGDTIMVEISARKNINIDDLLEMVQLKAEMMELKANPDRLARGVIIEARLDAKRGPVATLLVQAGTLRVGDNIVAGSIFGKIRAMIDEHGQRLTEALPSTPVEVLGINAPPQAGEKFVVVEQESQAREITEARASRARQDAHRPRHHLSLEDIASGKVKELKMILKTDVQGSLGALADSLERLSTSEISLKIIHSGVGAITESDVTLAAASDAMIIGFNLRPDTQVEKIAEREGVSIRTYRIIYEIIADVKAAMEGLLDPSLKETIVGKALVKQPFKVSKVGTISGCMVTDGKIVRGGKARLLRDNVIVFEGNISSLRRFKDDAREVEKGFECGIGLENFGDVKSGDVIEVFMQEKIARTL